MKKMYQNLIESLGLELIEIIEDRRGSLVLKVSRDGENFVLKCCDLSIKDDYDRGKLIRYEAVVLQEINDLIGNQYVSHGEDNLCGPWILLRWITGEKVSSLGLKFRASNQKDLCSKFTQLFISIISTYKDIHHRGFLHGDIQPQHILLVKNLNEIVLLDWGLAQRINGNNPPYKGGLIHYVAPEIARGMLEEISSIEYNFSSEIYSMGALLYFLYTGETAVNYGPGTVNEIPFKQKLEAVAKNNLRGFSNPNSECESRLQSIIKKCLSSESHSRFASTDALYDALINISN